jgi:hypothetical protein
MLAKLGACLLVGAILIRTWIAGWPGPLELVTLAVIVGFFAWVWISEDRRERRGLPPREAPGSRDSADVAGSWDGGAGD